MSHIEWKENSLRLSCLAWHGFVIFYLISNLIKTIYECYHYGRHSFLIKINMTLKVMKGHIRPI